MNRTALTLVIVGALNWLLIGLFQFDLVAAIFGGQGGVISRIIYCIIGIAGVWAISFWGRVARGVHDDTRDVHRNRREALNYEFGKDYYTIRDRKDNDDISHKDD